MNKKKTFIYFVIIFILAFCSFSSDVFARTPGIDRRDRIYIAEVDDHKPVTGEDLFNKDAEEEKKQHDLNTENILKGNKDKGLPDISNGNYKPETPSQGTIVEKASMIISVLIVVSIIIAVVAIAIFGFSLILGSASEKAVAKEKIIGIIIGISIIGGGLSLAKLIMTAAENF